MAFILLLSKVAWYVSWCPLLCCAADYRTMLQQREQAEADRKAAAINRLRAGYNTENRKRLAQGVEVRCR